jgi:mannose-6-phosphate isomerase-like protein (cupin superfamily)
MTFDDRTVTLPPRHGIEIAPEIPHQARNSSDAETRFLVISQPPSHGDRLS